MSKFFDVNEPTIFDEENYENIGSFVKKHKSFNMTNFEDYLDNELSLFITAPKCDFNKVEDLSNKIIENLPYLKKVFSKPWIILDDTREVLPVEYVKRMNSATFIHLSKNPRFVESKEEKKIVPNKLLSKIYIDDYCTYENKIFCLLINKILLFVHRNQRILNNLFYLERNENINFFDRTYHAHYLDALGKLKVSYLREYRMYLDLAVKLYGSLKKIDNSITPQLNKPVYKKNKGKLPKKIQLKRTNLFYHEKNYRQVYKLFNVFYKEKYLFNFEAAKKPEELKKNYFNFVLLLILFSVSNFNFKTDNTANLDLKHFDIDFNFKTFNLNIKNMNNEAILLTFDKEKEFKLTLVPLISPSINKDSYRQKYASDALFFLTNYEVDYYSNEDISINIQYIDSFRRIQQLLLLGMTYSSVKLDTCPYCGSTMKYNKTLKGYLCESCNELIKKNECKETNASFYSSSIYGYRNRDVSLNRDEDIDKSIYLMRLEKSLKFRNITRINENFMPICPYCNKVHGE